MWTWIESVRRAYGGIGGAFLFEGDDPGEVMDRSLAAVDSIIAIASWALTIMGIVVALVAIVGYTHLKAAATQRAEETARKAAEAYFRSEAFKAALKEQVRASEAIQERLGNALTPNEDGDDEDPFPKAPRREKKGG